MRTKKPFEDKLTPGERTAAGIYLPIHMFVLPGLLGIYAQVSPRAVDGVGINILYYTFGILFVLFFMRNYLRADFDTMLDNKARSILSFISAFALLFVLSLAVTGILIHIMDDGSNPNNDTVSDLITGGSGSMFGVIVMLAPVTEEVLFRGFIFGSLRRRSRLAAYIVSAAVFSFYHLWQYLLIYMDFGLIVFGMQYIPHSIALGWSYERSGSIWVPVFIHMLINGAAFFINAGYPMPGF